MSIPLSPNFSSSRVSSDVLNSQFLGPEFEPES